MKMTARMVLKRVYPWALLGGLEEPIDHPEEARVADAQCRLEDLRCNHVNPSI